MGSKRVLGIVLIVVALLAAACGGRSDDDDTASDDDTDVTESSAPAADDDDAPAGDDTTETVPEEVDPCDGVTLEATDTGVTPETITVVAMADVGSPLAQGLFQGALDGVEAWASHVNAEGGLACREVVVEIFDSALDANLTTNGFLTACSEALALVGTTVLFAANTTDLNNCADAAGNPTGVPDLASITTEAPHQCSANSFHVSRPGSSCPYEGGVRDHTAQVGAVNWIIDNVVADARGVFLVPADLASTKAATLPQVAAHESLGVVYEDVVDVSGVQSQPDYGPIVQTLRETGSNFVYNGSNDAAMIKLRSEAEVQGLDASPITWMCSLSCYTPDFIDRGGDDVEGTYIWMQFVPFDETADNPELGDFIDAIGDPFPASWAAGAWADGVMLETVIADIMATDGPNGVTRQAVLGGLGELTDFDANGWWSTSDLTTTNSVAGCIVIMQVQNGEYVRVFPEAPGTLDCEAGLAVEVSLDPTTFGA